MIQLILFTGFHVQTIVYKFALYTFAGSYNSEEKAARAHDLAALKYWGPSPSVKLNFPVRLLYPEHHSIVFMD